MAGRENRTEVVEMAAPLEEPLALVSAEILGPDRISGAGVESTREEKAGPDPLRAEQADRPDEVTDALGSDHPAGVDDGRNFFERLPRRTPPRGVDPRPRHDDPDLPPSAAQKELSILDGLEEEPNRLLARLPGEPRTERAT